MSSLKQIADRYDTDKATHTHYLRNYEDYFKPLLNRDIRLLELGIYHGGSLLLWRDYFQRGLIVGLDIEPVSVDDRSGRVRIYQGGQQDTALLDRIARETAPEGFDVIIDDCSHIGSLTRISFWHLFEHHLKSGGLYVIEDWGTGYWNDWIDGMEYRPRTTNHHPALYRLTRAISRLQKNGVAARVPFAGKILSRVKATTLKRQYHSHDFGMVGFVKELVDELGAGDITHPQYGRAPRRASKFREMRISHSHLFIVKA
ncbi:MAG TPA: hypothetical protein VEY11_13875 [Pyrinomonadaceae bacterium]|nr:hypothetical protein [Pyrinomonadaceae bacterium]